MVTVVALVFVPSLASTVRLYVAVVAELRLPGVSSFSSPVSDAMENVPATFPSVSCNTISLFNSVEYNTVTYVYE